MPRKYSFESSEVDEREPLDHSNYPTHYQQHIELEDHAPYYDNAPPASAAAAPYQQSQYDRYQPQPLPQELPQQSPPRQRQQQQQQYYPPSSSRQVHGPGFHPDSSFQVLSANRQYGRDRAPSGGAAPLSSAAAAVPAYATLPPAYNNTGTANAAAEFVSPVSPPAPLPHRVFEGQQQQQPDRDQYYSQPIFVPQPNVTPGADNFSESAAGGISGIAYSVAERNPRESGLEAMRGIQAPSYPHQQQQQQQQPPPQPPQPANHQYSPPPGVPQQAHQGGSNYPPLSYRSYSTPYDPADPGLRPGAYNGGRGSDRDSRSSMQGLGGAANPPGSATPGTRTPSRSPHSIANDVYMDDPYHRHSMADAHLGYVNPNEIEDDGDDGLEYGRSRPARTSVLSLVGHSAKSSRSGTASGAVGPATLGVAAIGAAPGGIAAAAALSHESVGMDGGGPMVVGDRVASSGGARYNALNNNRSDYAGGGGHGGYGGYNGGSGRGPEKSEWLVQQSHSSKRWKWAIIVGIALIAIAGIVLGVVFGVVLKHNNGSSGGGGSSQTASGDTATNGDLDINSAEIKKLLNNKNLHKVFPGIDYTPINTQYPDCLKNPASQNNVTRDIAVLSQLTNTIRLYGTDCNQTEMTVHAIRQLKMEDTVKIWLGVWQDNNATTNERQLAQMWDILNAYGADPFKGVIVANEILFREQMTTSQLSTLLTSVRTNLTAMDIDLPVATSDLGTVWDAELAQASDYVMANIHPFFGGVNAKDASTWTWNFWETNNGPFFKSDSSKNVISETGWPSQGGTDCGSGSTLTVCPDAAVAGISQLNQFMADWVCSALTNGTQYFWFEAFDEPWKISFDTGDQNWEDHWGLMDVNRNLKSGIKIPDCGGKTV